MRAFPHCTGTICVSDDHEFRFVWIKLGGKLTRQSLLNALKGVDNYTGNGLFGPQHVGAKMTGGCYGFITLKNGKWVREGPQPYSCQGTTHVGT